mmetsp:Transcript_10220/g.23614  ORF Transcript_10220/g.23614 Transcript_10220/m.23614 type:complete len:205 (+) Transcript_10220:454-1068(+)
MLQPRSHLGINGGALGRMLVISGGRVDRKKNVLAVLRRRSLGMLNSYLSEGLPNLQDASALKRGLKGLLAPLSEHDVQHASFLVQGRMELVNAPDPFEIERIIPRSKQGYDATDGLQAPRKKWSGPLWGRRILQTMEIVAQGTLPQEDARRDDLPLVAPAQESTHNSAHCVCPTPGKQDRGAAGMATFESVNIARVRPSIPWAT